MLIKEKKYYEPLELKYRNKDLIKTFKLNQFPNLKNLFKACSNNSNNFDNYNKIPNKLYTLLSFIKLKFDFINFSSGVNAFFLCTFIIIDIFNHNYKSKGPL